MTPPPEMRELAAVRTLLRRLRDAGSEGQHLILASGEAALLAAHVDALEAESDDYTRAAPAAPIFLDPAAFEAAVHEDRPPSPRREAAMRVRRMWWVESELRNILAVAHGDGGHRTESIGLEESVREAKEKIAEWKARAAGWYAE